MTTESELIKALDSDELKELVSSANASSARALIERGLRQRRAEIEVDLSKTTASRDAAIASRKSAEAKVDDETSVGLRPLRLVLAIVILIIAAVGGVYGLASGWPLARDAVASWAAPYSADFSTGAFWTTLYFAALIVLWETYFYLRRRPARRAKAESNYDLAGHRRAVEAANAARHTQLLELVRDHVTEMLNASHGPTFAAELRVRGEAASSKRQLLTLGVGLSEVINDDNRVSTDAQRRIVNILGSLSGASIGISGPRGVGKSTLLTALCGANPTINGRPALAIITSAPVEYEARDFLLHLFSSLCRQVLRTEGVAIADGEADALLEARRWRQISFVEGLTSYSRLLIFAGVGVLVTAVLLASLQSMDASIVERSSSIIPATISTNSPPNTGGQDSAQPPVSNDTRAVIVTNEAATASDPSTARTNDVPSIFGALLSSQLFTLGVVALVLGILMSFARKVGPVRDAIFDPRPGRGGYYYSDRNRLIQQAQFELRNIAFQRSYTSGWSGSLKVPVGFDLGASSGIALAQRPESLPELVERFRAFVSEVAVAYSSIVVIGIDELDKLKSSQQAEEFINGVKSIFGIPRCFYLISVSENALAAFERRGIGFRDAFDSALDDVVQLDFLNLDQSRALLNRRILRLSDPFLQLCHMLSGGLPRDLIRHARALLDSAEELPGGVISLDRAVGQLVSQDLAARLRATSIAMRTIRELPETSTLLVEVSAIPSNSTIPVASDAIAQFRAHVSGISELRNSEDGRLLLRFAEELAVYYETMILSRRVAVLLTSRRGWRRVTELKLAEGVAGVRQALEVSLPLAEMRLAELHKSVNEAAAAPYARSKER